MPTAIEIEPVDHRRLDSLDVDTLVLPMFSVVAQPQGAAGYLDWRLCGRLSRFLREGLFEGKADERVMMSYHERVGPGRILLYGLGIPGERSETRCHRDMESLVDVLTAAKAEVVALGAPEPGASTLVEHWLSAPALEDCALQRLVLLDALGELSAARERLEKVGSGFEWVQPPPLTADLED